MKSTFSTRIMSPVIMLAGCSILLAGIFYFLRSAFTALELIVFAVVALVWCWSLFGEIRLRVIRVELQIDRIVIRRYFGLGPPRVFYYSELDGYEIRVLPSEHDEYEYLFLKKNGKRIIRLSQFYHDNYPQLKAEIRRKLKGKDRVTV